MKITEHIKQEFGSRKGFLRFVYYQLLLKLGFYRQYQHVNFSTTCRLVFVCTGNICRSPFAEAIAKKSGVNCYSFGLDTRGGDAADPRAKAFASSRSFDLECHVTQKLSDYQHHAGDLLILMEPAHLRMLPPSLALIPVTFLGLWLDSPTLYLHDPYNTCIEYFHKCESQVQVATENILAKWNDHAR